MFGLFEVYFGTESLANKKKNISRFVSSRQHHRVVVVGKSFSRSVERHDEHDMQDKKKSPSPVLWCMAHRTFDHDDNEETRRGDGWQAAERVVLLVRQSPLGMAMFYGKL